MTFLVAFSVIHKRGNFVSSKAIETSTLSSQPVALRHIEYWETIVIPREYADLENVTIRVISFQPLEFE